MRPGTAKLQADRPHAAMLITVAAQRPDHQISHASAMMDPADAVKPH